MFFFENIVHRSASSLSITSKSDSLNLDETDFSIPTSTFLNNSTKKLTNSFKINTNINSSKQPPLPLKKPIISFRTNTQIQPTKDNLTSPSTPIPQISRQVKSIGNSLLINNKISNLNSNNKQVPPVPPRKSSIPRSFIKPQAPQRNSSTNLLLRKSHVSHV